MTCLLYLAKEHPDNKPSDSKPSNNHLTDTQSSHQSRFNWNAEKCFSEDELALHIRQFIAECLQKRILGFPSQAMGAVVHKYINSMSDEDDDDVDCIEKACKKVRTL